MAAVWNALSIILNPARCRIQSASREAAQGLVEYSLILLFVALVVLLIVGVYGTQVANLFSRVTNQIP